MPATTTTTTTDVTAPTLSITAPTDGSTVSGDIWFGIVFALILLWVLRYDLGLTGVKFEKLLEQVPALKKAMGKVAETRRRTAELAAGEERYRTLAEAAGPSGMITGQMADMLAEHTPGTLPVLRHIHLNKTARMFAASSAMGAIAGGGSDQQIGGLIQYGLKIGLGFQVADDILDETASTEQLGKTAGKDAAQHKITFPAVYGIEESRRMAERERSEAHAALVPFGERAQRLGRRDHALLGELDHRLVQHPRLAHPVPEDQRDREHRRQEDQRHDRDDHERETRLGVNEIVEGVVLAVVSEGTHAHALAVLALAHADDRLRAVGFVGIRRVALVGGGRVDRDRAVVGLDIDRGRTRRRVGGRRVGPPISRPLL